MQRLRRLLELFGAGIFFVQRFTRYLYRTLDIGNRSGVQLFTVVVEKDEKFLGMLTAKDIFKLIGKSVETVYIRVSGLEGEDDFIKTKVDEMIENTLSKLVKVIPVNYIAIHAETHQTGGRKTKYAVQGRLVTEKGSFFADDTEWDPTKAVKIFLEKIEREVHSKIGMKRSR